MSLDNTSQPSVKYCVDNVNARYIHGRPEPELVPSRYALKVGEIDVLVVSDGVLSLPGAMLGHNFSNHPILALPAVRTATRLGCAVAAQERLRRHPARAFVIAAFAKAAHQLIRPLDARLVTGFCV
jgi:hypothetical protein